MDTNVQPRADQLQVRVDTVVSDTDVFTWGTDVMAQSDIILPGLTPTDVDMILPVSQNKYRTALGAKVPVYDLAAFHVIITANTTFDGAVHSTTMTFNLAMDQTVLPDFSDFVITINGTPDTPDQLFWVNPTQLLSQIVIPGVPPVSVEVEFMQANNNFRSSLNSIMCPFSVTSTIS